MRTVILSLLLLIGFAVQAQLSKTEKTILEVNKTKKDVEGAVTLGKELGGLFKKKKKAEPEASKVDTLGSTKETAVKKQAGTSTTMLIVTGLDFTKLKALNENIKVCMGVQTTNMKYGQPSSIEISHAGTTEDVMKLITEISKDIFTDKNITGFEEGKVSIKL